MRKKLSLALALALLPTVAACTALLGSYEVGATSGGTTDGGGLDATGDAIASETGPSGEGGVDGGDGAAPAPLKCSLNATNARTLDTGPFTQTLFAFAIAGNQTRVITTKFGQGVVMYTYDRNGGGPTQITPLNKIGQVLAVRRLANGIGILSIDTASAPATGTSLGFTLIDDANGGTSNITFRLVQPASQYSGSFAPLGSDYLYAYGDGNGTIQAGRYTAGGTLTTLTVASGVTGGAGNVKTVEVDNGKMYVFNDVGPDGSNGNASAGYYAFPDTVAATGPLTSLGSGTPGKASFTIATDSALGNFQAGVVELDLASGTPPAVLHAGTVPAGKGTTFNVTDVPTAFTFATLVDAPFGDHSFARFQGNDFIALGPNPNKDPGLDFVWFDTKTKSLRASNGNADKLLPQRSISAVAAIVTQTTGIFANLDVVWLEGASQMTGAPPGTLFSAQMNCIK